MKQPSIGIQAADKAVVSVVKQSANSGTVKAESAPQNIAVNVAVSIAPVG